MYFFCVFLCIFALFYVFVCFVTYSVLFVCKCVLNYCHRVATKVQLNTSYQITVSMRHLVFVTLCGWPPVMPSCIPDSHPHRVTNTRCRIDTVISPDDGHIVARNMYGTEINIQEKLCTGLVSFTRLYKDARWTKHKTHGHISARFTVQHNKIHRYSKWLSGF